MRPILRLKTDIHRQTIPSTAFLRLIVFSSNKNLIFQIKIKAVQSKVKKGRQTACLIEWH